MYWIDKMVFQCGQCNTKRTYSNPGKHGMGFVIWKAIMDGWSIPASGQHLCPDCKKKLAHQIGMPEEWLNNTPKVKAIIEEIKNLPEPPRLLED
jgi:hypothetical protein